MDKIEYRLNKTVTLGWDNNVNNNKNKIQLSHRFYNVSSLIAMHAVFSRFFKGCFSTIVFKFC